MREFFRNVGTEWTKPGSLAERRAIEEELVRKQRSLADVGGAVTGDYIPAFLRPGGAHAMTPEQMDASKARRLFALGTPEAAAMATQFTETPDTRMKQADFGLKKADTESAIEARRASTDISRASLALQREEQALTKKDKDRNYMLAAKKLEAELSGGNIDPKEVFDRETKLRGEYINQSRDYVTRRDAYDNIQSLAQSGGGASDIALLTAFMKLQDPGSTVREGEFATAENAPGVNEKVLVQYNKLLTGDKLTPEARKKFVDVAGTTFKSAQRQHTKRTNQYEGLATRAGVNPKQVLVDMEIAPVEEIPTGGSINAPIAPTATKVIGGKSYIQQDGKWYQQ